MWSRKNITKTKIMWKMIGADGCDGNKATVTNNNTRRRGRRRRCSGRESTDIRGDMVGGTSVKVLAMLGWLLELKHMELCSQGC
jgi:hypothetical protein